MENTVDINSQGHGNAKILSNLYKKPFIMNGFVFASIEGLLQGMRIKDPKDQESVFIKHGIDAKRVGYSYPIKNQTMYWQGTPINRHSEKYSSIVRKAFCCCFAQNDLFRQSICDTLDQELIHSIGKNDPFETILTNDEFIGHLHHLRTLLMPSDLIK